MISVRTSVAGDTRCFTHFHFTQIRMRKMSTVTLLTLKPAVNGHERSLNSFIMTQMTGRVNACLHYLYIN